MMKSNIQWILICITALAIGLAALATKLAATSPAPTTAPSASPITVEIDNFNFKPKELTVKPGQTVIWINHDDVPHTATMKGKSPTFDSKMLDTDEQYSFTFKNAGTYPYYCKVHPHMTATIVVK
jgi:plastocyanin